MKSGLLAFALVLTVAFSGCVAAPSEGLDVWQEDCFTIGAMIPLSCLDPPGEYVITKVEVWDDLVKYDASVDPSDSYCNTLFTPRPWEFIIHVCPGFYWQGKDTFVRVTFRGPMGTGAETTYVLEDSFAQLACPLDIVGPADGWESAIAGKTYDWVAKGRYGDNLPTTGKYELEVGFGDKNVPPGPALRDEGNHGWTSGQTETFSVVYNGITHMATFTVSGAGDPSVTYNVGPAPAEPCNTQTLISIHPKSKVEGSVVITNLMLNGVSIGSITSNGSPEVRHLTITTGCYLTSFTLSGSVTFSWGSTADERPAFDIYVKYLPLPAI